MGPSDSVVVATAASGVASGPFPIARPAVPVAAVGHGGPGLPAGTGSWHGRTLVRPFGADQTGRDLELGHGTGGTLARLQDESLLPRPVAMCDAAVQCVLLDLIDPEPQQAAAPKLERDLAAQEACSSGRNRPSGR